MKNSLKKLLITAVFAAVVAPAAAGNPYFVVGYVWSSAGTAGTLSTANSYAGVTILRHSLPGQPAIQVGGADPAYSSRIYPAQNGKAAYYATDAGSQWSTPLSAGWTLLSVSEVENGKHGWTGGAFAGAVKATVTSADVTSPRYTMPDTYPAPIPPAILDWAANTKIALKIGYFEDASGLAQSLGVFRRALGAPVYSHLGNISLPGPGTTVDFSDASVTAGTMYDYAVAVNFSWPGGSGVGGLPGELGIFSTTARAKSGPYMASEIQPTPTVVATAVPEKVPTFEVPEGWLAYPNPATGPHIFVAIKAEKETEYRIRAYNLVGENVVIQSGRVEGRGIHKIAVPISKLASGIYFMHLDLTEDGASTVELPIHKIAILH